MDKTVDQKTDIKDSSEEIMHSMKASVGKKPFTMKFLILLIFVALLGIGTGYMLSGGRNSSGVVGKLGKIASSNIEKGKTYGDGDASIFKDTAEGQVKEGGIEGEGQFHLVRVGGDSQNVYMTSSTVDLSEFIDRKVKVWGQTQKAQKAGWLMDVGKVQVLD